MNICAFALATYLSASAASELTAYLRFHSLFIYFASASFSMLQRVTDSSSQHKVLEDNCYAMTLIVIGLTAVL